MGVELDNYELFIPGRAKYCKRERLLSAYKLKDMVIKGGRKEKFMLFLDIQQEKSERSEVVNLLLLLGRANSEREEVLLDAAK